MLEKLQPLVEMKAAYQEKIKNDGRTLLLEALNDFFEKYPKIEELSWTQYTPYFNDGDACYFSVNADGLEFKLQGRYEREMVDYGLDREESLSVEDRKMVKQAYNELRKALNSIEDVLEEVFGDHAEIIVSREEVRVESCDHE